MARMAAIDSDTNILMDLLNRIKFFRNSMEESALVSSIEYELAKHFEFQLNVINTHSTDNPYSKRQWEYYIRCSLRYPNIPIPKSESRLDSLATNLEFLLKHKNCKLDC